MQKIHKRKPSALLRHLQLTNLSIQGFHVTLEHCSSSNRTLESHGNTKQLDTQDVQEEALFLPPNRVAMLLLMEL